MAISFTVDPDDFDLQEFLEEVTFVRVTPDGSETEYGHWQTWDDIPAVGRAVQESVSAPGAQMTPQTALWRIKASALVVKPARGDRIISYSTRMAGTWQIMSCQVEVLGTHYVCRDCQLLLEDAS